MYIYTYIHLYIHICIYMCIYICIYMYICIYISVYIYVSICICIYSFFYKCVNIYIYMWTYVCICMCICVYALYICICMHIVIQTHLVGGSAMFEDTGGWVNYMWNQAYLSGSFRSQLQFLLQFRNARQLVSRLPDVTTPPTCTQPEPETEKSSMGWKQCKTGLNMPLSDCMPQTQL